MMSSRSVVVAVALLLPAAFAGAQVDAPCVPTDAKPCQSAQAPVPYSTPQFLVTFNGRVETWSEPNVQKTSADFFYASKSGDIEQTVVYRSIGHEIPVEQSSLDYYVKENTKHGEVLKSRQDGSWHGHIFMYIDVATADNRHRRTWLMIRDSHTVYVLMQSSPAGVKEDEDWNKFYGSFELNEKTCFLPEGCKQ
jgi:hypothetical protein